MLHLGQKNELRELFTRRCQAGRLKYYILEFGEGDLPVRQLTISQINIGLPRYRYRLTQPHDKAM